MKTKSALIVVVCAALAMAFTYSLGYQQGYRQGASQARLRNVSQLKNVGLAFKTHYRNVMSTLTVSGELVTNLTFPTGALTNLSRRPQK